MTQPKFIPVLFVWVTYTPRLSVNQPQALEKGCLSITEMKPQRKISPKIKTPFGAFL